MKLYELTEEYRVAQMQMEEANVDEETINDTLEGIKGEITVKITNIGKIIRNLSANADVLGSEIDRLTSKKHSLENRVDHLKRYLMTEMDKLNMERVEDPIITVAYTQNAPSVFVRDLNRIPGTYFVEPDPMLNKKQILEDLKAGKTIDGVELQRTKSIKIK